MRGAICLLLLWGVLALDIGTAVANPPERQDREALRVCMDGNNMPFSNEAGEGFENRIAELMAEDMGVPLAYVWAPQVMGFVRNTLELRVCDVMIGAVAGYEFVQNTNEYYRSIYALVVPEASGIEATSLEDPSLQGLRLGVVAETPPMVALRRTGAVVVGYPLMVDTRVRAPVRDAVEDVAAGNTDGAVLWGPLAGYYASRQEPPLRVLPLVDDTSGARLDYRITMGIRRGEPHWKDWINDFIDRHQEEIHAILREYRVPLLDRRGQLIVPDDEGES
ncbi:quinoprotein dehydrogenase-associated putative ABC transporter substrate-binding protein [Halomonas sp. M5N1S17]|uniref:quinoprotein dehydrogenase-associated putative ABC transporter substrate-binding protein n=1 Tax=Halomonas alkalisoli TaxID=2907158 RepID=UPI001F3A2459|nr:quinoprotein dehydrogenase-associated putative ABC transporter substrate-binding protein [Halomonas alkalisoli]MCE9665679.1 quinoprotein dehydrogenase-associated putative ABC transporter substrate-binding protein [Halomonas alkalisoli]